VGQAARDAAELNNVPVGGGALADFGTAAQLGQNGAVVAQERLGALGIGAHGEECVALAL